MKYLENDFWLFCVIWLILMEKWLGLETDEPVQDLEWKFVRRDGWCKEMDRNRAEKISDCFLFQILAL